MFQIKGRFLRIENKREFVSQSNGNTYRTGLMVCDITSEDEWSQNGRTNIAGFECFGQKLERAESLAPNTIVTIGFNISGREYAKNGEARVFTKLDVVNIDVATSTDVQPIEGAPVAQPSAPTAAAPQTAYQSGYQPTQQAPAPQQAAAPASPVQQPAPQPAYQQAPAQPAYQQPAAPQYGGGGDGDLPF